MVLQPGPIRKPRRPVFSQRGSYAVIQDRTGLLYPIVPFAFILQLPFLPHPFRGLSSKNNVLSGWQKYYNYCFTVYGYLVWQLLRDLFSGNGLLPSRLGPSYSYKPTFGSDLYILCCTVHTLLYQHIWICQHTYMPAVCARSTNERRDVHVLVQS